MTRTLLLHIGMPKCGSTFLQRVLRQNQSALAKADIAFPCKSSDPHPGNGSGFGEATPKMLEAALGNHKTLILSHEDLFAQGLKANVLGETARDLDVQVHVLSFIRPFSQFVFGDYSQNMKQNFDQFMINRRPYSGRNFEAFAVLRSSSLKPAQRFRHWLTALTVEGGHEPQFTLASYRKIEETVTPFLNGAAMNWTVPSHQSNPSLRMEDCDRLAKMIRDKSIDAKTVAKELRTAMGNAGEPDAGRTNQRTRWIEAIFVKQNTDLREIFNYDNRVNAKHI